MARKQNLPTWPSSRRQFHEAIDVIGCNEYQASTGFHRPQRIKQGIAFRPWAEARSSIDMPGSLYKDEPASPCLGVLPSPLRINVRSEAHTSELQSPVHLVSRLLLEKTKPPRVTA